MIRWQVREEPIGSDELAEALADGWEPFAAYLNVGVWIVLRYPAEPVVEPTLREPLRALVEATRAG